MQQLAAPCYKEAKSQRGTWGGEGAGERMRNMNGHLAVSLSFVFGLSRVSFSSHVCADGCRAYVQRVAVSFRYPVRVLKHQLAVGKAKGAWEGHDYAQRAKFRRGLRGRGVDALGSGIAEKSQTQIRLLGMQRALSHTNAKTKKANEGGEVDADTWAVPEQPGPHMVAMLYILAFVATKFP